MPGNPTTAAYAVLENPAPIEVQIVSVSAEVAGEVELHSMVRTGDMMKMSQVKYLAVPSRALAVGVPARMRPDAVDAATIAAGVSNYLALADRFRQGLRRLD